MAFFYAEAKGTKRSRGRAKVSKETLLTAGCTACPRNRDKELMSPKMEASGVEEPVFYFLGGAPDWTEDEENELFIGDAPRRVLQDFSKDVLNTKSRFNNVINCVTDDPKDKDLAMSCCRKRIIEDIEKAKPDIVVGTSKYSLKWLIGTFDVGRWRGRLMPVNIGNHCCWFSQLTSGSYLLGNQRKDTRGNIRQNEDDYCIKMDTKRIEDFILEDYEEPFVENEDSRFDNLLIISGKKGRKDLDKIKKALARISKEKSVGFDYETTALRPYYKDSHILSVAIGTAKETVTFPLWHPEGWQKKEYEKEAFALLKDFLEDYPGIKICHNLKFEQEWTGMFFGGYLIHETKWGDTMAQGYALDARKGMLSLGIMTQVHLGFNLKKITLVDAVKWKEYPIEEYLKYNALDSKYTHELYYVLDKKIVGGLRWVYNHLIRTSGTLALTQLAGVPADVATIDRFSIELQDKMDDIFYDIDDLPEVQNYKKRHKDFSPMSTKQLIDFFKKEYDLDEEIKTKKGSYSVDEEHLKQIDDIPIAKMILDLRSMIKLKSTYVDSVAELVCDDGLIHGEFNLYWTATGRLSSSGPNLQNFPKRKNKYVRAVIGAPKGQIVAAVDFGQIEARIIGCASLDKNFCEAIWDDYDIHMEWAQYIASVVPSVIGGKKFRNDPAVMKGFRGKIKNGMVFPAFYGASAYSIANGMDIDPKIMVKIFDKFWKTFSGVKEWQIQLLKDYEKNGYVESLTGRRRYAPVGYNEAINTPIQGTASDIVTNAMNVLSEQGMQARINVHDDLTFILDKKYYEDDIDFIAKEMCMSAVDDFDFITVPMSIEVETGPNWADLEVYKTYSSKDFGFKRK